MDDLAHVEFDRPDFPWLFTPAGPDAAGRLVPWITLVVAERRHVDWGERRGSAQAARIRRDQLQPLSDAWAWAHAQVMGAKGATAEGAGQGGAHPAVSQTVNDLEIFTLLEGDGAGRGNGGTFKDKRGRTKKKH